jgi:hypothetical protein
LKANLIMWLNKFSSDLLIDIDIIYILYTMKEHVVPLLISILNTMYLSLSHSSFFHFPVFDWLPLDEINKEMIKRLMVFNNLTRK